ncbi:MAG: hypothetical protein EPN84_08025 [Legionella sp.]|nr:MAG: hypothetical protein EPN84_08025 [Legionella sp.]
MDSLFLATVIGWYLVIVSLFLLFNFTLVKSIINEVMAQRGLLFIVALLTLILGIMMVTSHNIWVFAWPVVVTIFSWMVLIGGIVRLFFLERIAAMSQSFLSHPNRIRIMGVVWLVVGLYLLFHVYAIYLY